MQGHFPGNPLVPGALLLSQALFYAQEHTGRLTHDYHVLSARFLHPVRPGDVVEVQVDAHGDKLSLACRVGSVPIMKATVQCASPTTVR